MPATYRDPRFTLPQVTLTVGELIQILAKRPLDAPVVLTYEGVDRSVLLESIAMEYGCVVIDAEKAGGFEPMCWQNRPSEMVDAVLAASVSAASSCPGTVGEVSAYA